MTTTQTIKWFDLQKYVWPKTFQKVLKTKKNVKFLIRVVISNMAKRKRSSCIKSDGAWCQNLPEVRYGFLPRVHGWKINHIETTPTNQRSVWQHSNPFTHHITWHLKVSAALTLESFGHHHKQKKISTVTCAEDQASNLQWDV